MRAILFDLDGTLLDIDINDFMKRYLGALAQHSESLYPGRGLMDAMMAGVHEMMGVHPGRTNREVFFDRVRDMTDLDLGEHWHEFERFYTEHFDALRGSAGPREGGLAALDTAIDLGAKVAVATNPMFPRIAIDKRMAWAGVDGRDVDLVTTYEEFFACKPHAAYFEQVAESLGVPVGECLMVGDDAGLDLPAGDIGMATFYVGSDPIGVSADYIGGFDELTRLLPEMVEASPGTS